MRKMVFRRMLFLGVWMGCLLVGHAQSRYEQILQDIQTASPTSSPEHIWQQGLAGLAMARDKQSLENEVTLYLALADAPVSYAFNLHEAQIDALRTLFQQRPLPKGAIYQELGYLYFFQGMPQVALQHFRQAVKKAPQQETAYQAWMGMATVHNSIDSQQLALQDLKQGLSIAQSLSDTSLMIPALNQLATIHFSIGKWEQAESYFTQLLSLMRTPGNERALASELRQVGTLLLHQGAFDRAQTYLFEALELTTHLPDTLQQTSLYTDIASGFLQQKDWEKAVEYAQKGLFLAQVSDANLYLAQNYHHLGVAYQAVREPKSAQQAYLAALNLYQMVVPNLTQATNIQIRLAELFEASAAYEQAVPYLEKALAHKRQYSDMLSMMQLQLTLSGIHLKQGQPKLAIPRLAEALTISQALPSLQGAAKALSLLSEAEAELGNYPQAYTYQLQLVEVNDSLYTSRQAEITHELDSKYQAAQKDRANALLAAELAQQALENEQKTLQNYLLIGCVIFLLLGFIFVRYTYLKRRQLLQEQVKTLEKEREVETLRAVIRGEEQERQRLARELHDGLGAQLASIKMIVSSIQNDVPEVADAPSHQQAEHMLDQACSDVRDISHNLMPSSLKKYGLFASVRDLCLTVSQSHSIPIDCLIHEVEVDIPAEIASSAFRLIQELLSNAVKHAQATDIIVQVEVDDNRLLLTVEDDGIGFDPHAPRRESGIGLANIRTRVEFLQGEIDFDSKMGEGTSVYISIPISAA